MQGIICKCHPWRIPLPVVLQTDILYAHKMEDYFLFAVFFCSHIAHLQKCHLPTPQRRLHCAYAHTIINTTLRWMGQWWTPFIWEMKKKRIKKQSVVCWCVSSSIWLWFDLNSAYWAYTQDNDDSQQICLTNNRCIFANILPILIIIEDKHPSQKKPNCQIWIDRSAVKSCESNIAHTEKGRARNQSRDRQI